MTWGILQKWIDRIFNHQQLRFRSKHLQIPSQIVVPLGRAQQGGHTMMKRQNHGIGLGRDHRKTSPQLSRLFPNPGRKKPMIVVMAKTMSPFIPLTATPLIVRQQKNQTAPPFKSIFPHRTGQFIAARIVNDPKPLSLESPAHWDCLPSREHHRRLVRPSDETSHKSHCLLQLNFRRTFCGDVGVAHRFR